MKQIYLLKMDADGTLRSSDRDFGYAVTTEKEAKRFVAEGGMGYTHSYSKIKIIENKDEAFI